MQTLWASGGPTRGLGKMGSKSKGGGSPEVVVGLGLLDRGFRRSSLQLAPFDAAEPKFKVQHWHRAGPEQCHAALRH